MYNVHKLQNFIYKTDIIIQFYFIFIFWEYILRWGGRSQILQIKRQYTTQHRSVNQTQNRMKGFYYKSKRKYNKPYIYLHK